MLQDIAFFLLQTACGLYASLLLLRAWAFACNASLRQPVGQAIQSLTDVFVLPLRRLLPKTGVVDMASLLLAWLVGCVYLLGTALLFVAFSGAASSLVTLPWHALLTTGRWAIQLLIGVLIAQAVLSFVQPHSPLAGFAQQLTHPLLNPIRRHLPAAGGIDWSPLVLIIAAQVLLIVLR
jgi:YggT family protein